MDNASLIFTDNEIDTPARELAPIGSRYLASVIDYAIIFGFYAIMAHFFGKTEFTPTGGYSVHLGGWAAFACFLVWFIVLPAPEAIAGQTLGKMLLRIKVIRTGLYPVSFGSAVAKHLFDYIDFLPFLGIVGLIVARRSRYRQRVGDLVADTVVVKT